MPLQVNQTSLERYLRITTSNYLYNDYKSRWQFYLESYLGGEEYRQAGHLTRYQLETPKEYQARLDATPLDNHCKSVISVYISFLFREEPDRDFENNGVDFTLEMFLRDADLEGRSLNAFMKEVAIWSNVFGHCWVIISKPNVGAQTQADEINQGVRPYVNIMTPLTVLDWTWSRSPSGHYELTYFKYVEEINDTLSTIKIWTKEQIETYVVDTKEKKIEQEFVEINGLGEIPAVQVYATRSPIRGIGSSTISDIADQQRAIYNEYSEIEQLIRLQNHPALVKTPDTEAGAGAGAIIMMPDGLDPGLKPFLLEPAGNGLTHIYDSISRRISAIDKMANTGAVRAVESRTMSGVAMQTEFQLLNAKLSELADNLELAEEQMFQYYYKYLGQQWMGEIEYPGSFNVRDTSMEIEQLGKAKQAATDPRILQGIDYKIMDWLDLSEDDLAEMQQYAAVVPAVAGVETAPVTPDTASCPIATQDIGVNLANRQTAIDTANYGPLNPALPNQVFWMAKAEMWNTDEATAKQSLCGNCSFFDQTTATLACIDAGLTAGGTTGNEWDSVGGGQLGYCEAFDFKCKSTRTCDAWVAGGPVTDATPTQGA
jgi:hypothetical protein